MPPFSVAGVGGNPPRRDGDGQRHEPGVDPRCFCETRMAIRALNTFVPHASQTSTATGASNVPDSPSSVPAAIADHDCRTRHGPPRRKDASCLHVSSGPSHSWRGPVNPIEISRRRALRTLLLGISGAVVAGCGDKQDSAATTTAATSPGAAAARSKGSTGCGARVSHRRDDRGSARQSDLQARPALQCLRAIQGCRGRRAGTVRRLRGEGGGRVRVVQSVGGQAGVRCSSRVARRSVDCPPVPAAATGWTSVCVRRPT